MAIRFGTDGIRGRVGGELTPELVMALGRAAAQVLGGRPTDGSRGSLLVGRDTRLSGPMLQAAFSAGVAAEGVDVVDLGVAPTPAVAAAAAERAQPAAVISASHNPFEDNGIKLFAPGGLKLSDDEEEEVEDRLEHLRSQPAPSGVEGDRLGRLVSAPDALSWYCRRVVEALDGRRLGRIRVVIDCANGAASATAAEILTAAGAEVVEVLAAAPDGVNINAGCGSTDPSTLARAVVAHGAAAGLAFDGDADRVIAVDDHGQVVDGDRLLALFAVDQKNRGLLAEETVVVTVMTNMGFYQAMEDAGITVWTASVGDRYVLEALEEFGGSLGGEQSGHIIFRRLATTGDGVMSGMMLLDVLARSGRSLSDLAASAMVRFPQVLTNVAVSDLSGLERTHGDRARSVWDLVGQIEAELAGSGRVLLRPSGTEKLIRVMVEAPTEAEARSAVDRLARAVTSALG